MSRIRGFLTAAQEATRPYVACYVWFPRLLVGAAVRLLVDTGADTTTIHWGDRVTLTTLDGLPLPSDVRFQEDAQAAGISGVPVAYGREQALLVLVDEEGTPVYFTETIQIALDTQTQRIPSLLGRDLMRQMRLTLDLPAGEVFFDRD